MLYIHTDLHVCISLTVRQSSTYTRKLQQNVFAVPPQCYFTFFTIPYPEKFQILSRDTVVANQRYVNVFPNASGNLYKTLQTLLISFLCKILHNLMKYFKLSSTNHKCRRNIHRNIKGFMIMVYLNCSNYNKCTI